MGRPADWQPLADSDPVPGDPAAISSAAAHLASVAQLIGSQVAQLRKIASGHSDERGKHVERLKSAASDTAGQLVKVVGRYQKTAAALTNWVPDLEYAQSQSLKALAQAQDAAARVRANQPVSRPPGTKLTTADKQADQARVQALGQAQTDLAAARALLATTVSYFDQKGSEIASRINSAINDGMVDSWLDDIGGFFSAIGHWFSSNWVAIVKDVCTGLEILATLLAVACLFIPGLDIIDVLLMVAFGATVLATAGRLALAVTGNGSWLDFGLDLLACLTFGLSNWVLSPGLESAAKGAVQAGEELLQDARDVAAAKGLVEYFGSTAGRLIGQGRAAELASQWAAEDIPDLALNAGKTSYLSKFVNAIKAGGSLGDYQSMSKITTVYARYADNPAIANALRSGGRTLNALRVAGAASWGGALSGMVGGGGEMDGSKGPVFRLTIPGISSGWNWFEHATTRPLPGFKVATGGAG